MVNVHSFLRDYFRRTLLFNLSFGISAHLAAECRFEQDRKSTRLNSSHTVISYAVFCLKKKKKKPICPRPDLLKNGFCFCETLLAVGLNGSFVREMLIVNIRIRARRTVHISVKHSDPVH